MGSVCRLRGYELGGVRGRVWGFLGFRRIGQLLAIEDQISEYLSDDQLALPDASFCDSKLANILA